MKSSWIDTLIALLLCGLVLFACLGSHLFTPNQWVFAFGGDPAILYYNTIYHALHGSGIHLSHMNYPLGDSILMTDAQASVSMLLNKLNGFQFVRDNIIGFYHGFHYICFGLAVMFMHRTFLKLGVNRWLSILGALLVVFFSPQIFRLRSHFGLAYPIVFTASIYAIISFRLERKWSYGLLLFSVLLFFGINNIYLIILVGGLCFLSVAIDWLLNKENEGLLLLPFIILPIAITFFLIKWSSPEMDRLIVQWGYYPNRIKLEGLFYPFTSLIGSLLGETKKNLENVVGLGLVNSLALVFLMVGLLMKKSRTPIKNFFNNHKFLTAMGLASLIMLIYASGALKPLAEAMPAATMFKASGRFAWPFYYILSMISIVGIDHLFRKWGNAAGKKKYLLLIPLLIWLVEDSNYLFNVVKFRQHDNFYSPAQLKGVEKELTKNNIDLSKYQAMYGLPVMEAWNDKFHYKIPFNTEYNATRISMATGLPMINAMISRIGLSQAGEAVQLASHPWIKKRILDKLDSRPILLVLGKESPLTEGEEYLKFRGELILDAKSYALYKLNPEDIKNIPLPACKDAQYDFEAMGFDTDDSEVSLTGNGAYEVTHEQSIFEIGGLKESNRFNYHDMCLSLYVHSTNKKYGMPWVRVEQFDEEKNSIKADKFDVAATKDIIKNWKRVNCLFDKKDETDSISVSLFQMNQDFVIDNFLLSSRRDTICQYYGLDSSEYLINNYLIED